LVADLLGGAAHVDIDDLRTVVAVAPGCVGHHLRVATGSLCRARIGLAGLIQTLAGLAAVSQAAVAGDQLPDRQAGTQLPAHAPERSISHAGHRGKYGATGKLVGSDLDHCWPIPVLGGQWYMPRNRRHVRAGSEKMKR